MFGVDLDGLLQGLECLLGALERLEGLGLHEVGGDHARVGGDHLVGLREGLLELAGVDRDLPELELRLQVLGVETDRLAQLPETRPGLLALEVRLGEAPVGGRLVRIELKDVLELDDRLGVLLLLEIRITASLMLDHLLFVRFAGEDGDRNSCDGDSKKHTHSVTSFELGPELPRSPQSSRRSVVRRLVRVPHHPEPAKRFGKRARKASGMPLPLPLHSRSARLSPVPGAAGLGSSPRFRLQPEWVMPMRWIM